MRMYVTTMSKSVTKSVVTICFFVFVVQRKDMKRTVFIPGIRISYLSRSTSYVLLFKNIIGRYSSNIQKNNHDDVRLGRRSQNQAIRSPPPEMNGGPLPSILYWWEIKIHGFDLLPNVDGWDRTPC